ncbi:hypothetical protein H5200_14940 [Pseudoalteromonas sp. SG43-7]|uniref:Uncharacterized protein n=1 Tax=Pseudoalteromonas neustonica TaxID=1840331 RepID=A0ABY3F9U1_9GAMM|nr:MULTISPECIES: hypothetical protein [Pseudoalteromonas]MBB1294047.1 hypothetical protein [Pseudoalteromonas sp. SR41-4]MBB1301454.1 hypothetical protein [Pseudoalteromonas sp. SR44-8]MBB1310765.1 hypothetical protein [Pseudoalteromonas sp. SR41-8]MBB1334995.1 hypothetical protein [Pseudoalteromonas sp. SR41-6]MBB1397198.1 hypothetical protein [Pseudoalteromonas sp. SG44-8]
MNSQNCPPAKTHSTLSRWQLRARALFAGRELFSVLVILLINSAMLVNGSIEDATELKSLLTEGAVYESSLINVLGFLAYPVVSCQLLIGLCWLIFHFFPARRAGVILRKAAFAFRQTKTSLVVHSAHGCRAPPLVNG